MVCPTDGGLYVPGAAQSQLHCLPIQSLCRRARNEQRKWAEVRGPVAPAAFIARAWAHTCDVFTDEMRRRGYGLAAAAEIPSMLAISASVRRRSMAAAAAAACSGREAPGMATTVSP